MLGIGCTEVDTSPVCVADSWDVLPAQGLCSCHAAGPRSRTNQPMLCPPSVRINHDLALSALVLSVPVLAFCLTGEGPAGLPETVHPHWEADKCVCGRPVLCGTGPSWTVRGSLFSHKRRPSEMGFLAPSGSQLNTVLSQQGEEFNWLHEAALTQKEGQKIWPLEFLSEKLLQVWTWIHWTVAIRRISDSYHVNKISADDYSIATVAKAKVTGALKSDKFVFWQMVDNI